VNKLILFAAAGALALAGCGPSGGPAAPATPTTTLTAASDAATATPKKGGLISIARDIRPSILIEAESGAIHAPVVLKEDKDASGGKYVIAPEGPNHEEISIGGDVTYKLHVTEPGDYSLWLRANWCCGCGNSMNLSLDGEALGTVEDSVFKTWHWVKLQKPLRKLTAGDHLLVLGNREDGSGVDQILLTQDADYRPTGIESAEVQGRSNGVAPTAPAATAPSADATK